MRLRRGWCVGMLLVWVGGAGCTALREIPRAEYVERVGPRPVHVVTSRGDGLELESARIVADSLIGERRLDVEGPIDEFEIVRLPLDDVASISTRRIDWYRTGMVGLSAAVVIGVAAAKANSNGGGGSGDGGGKTPLPE